MDPSQPLCFLWRHPQLGYHRLSLQRRSAAVGLGRGSRSVPSSRSCPSCFLVGCVAGQVLVKLVKLLAFILERVLASFVKGGYRPSNL